MRDRPKVGEILIQAGILEEAQLATALAEQTRWGRRLGLTLIKLGLVQEGQLVRALARQFDLPVASLAGKKIAPEVIALVPAKFACEHSVVPLFVKKEGHKEQLFLGMEEPSDLGVLDDLAFRTGMSIRPVMVGPSEIGEALDRYYNSKPAASNAQSKRPDPVPASDTLTENNLRRVKEDPAPSLSQLLTPAAPVPHADLRPIESKPYESRPFDLLEPAPATPATPAPAVAPTPVAAPPTSAPAKASDPIPMPVTTAPAPDSVEAITAPVVTPLASAAPAAPVAPVAQIALVAAPFAPAMAAATIPAAAMPSASPIEGPSIPMASAAEIARAVEETERTRLVAKAIAHLLIEKGLLTLDELQARIEKMKSVRPGSPM